MKLDDWYLTGTLHDVSRDEADKAAHRNPPAAIKQDGESFSVYYLSRTPTRPGQSPFYMAHGHSYQLVGDFS